MDIKFKKEGESIINKLFIRLEYMSGDADAYEYDELPLNIPFDKYEKHLPEIEKIVSDYKLISRFTDCNDKLYMESEGYDYIKEKYSKEIADLYDAVPGDSTCDGQVLAHLSEIQLVGYNDKGVKFVAYL
jgi:hypothetical protein